MTTEGWVDVMNAGLDSVKQGMQPQTNHNVIIPVIFFIAFMITGS